MNLCSNRDQFLHNLRKVNEQAGVTKETVDIIVAFARLRHAHDGSIDFYPRCNPRNDPIVYKFLEKNRHLEKRTRRFLTAYFHEMHKRGLRCILSTAHLAHLLEITPGKLNWFTSDIKPHYVQFQVPKHNGKFRKIDSPRPRLKKIQRKILAEILNQVPLNSHAEGFVRQKSILTNASRHVGKKVVIRLDISDFFPSISFSRVVGIFEALGYPNNVAQTIGKLTSHQGRLPIGAPTSPAISNIICRKMDKRFVNLGKKCDFIYSRYADDIAISSNNNRINGMIPFFQKIIQEEGFTVNQTKTIVMRNGSRQKITGVVVNNKTSVPREEIRKLRATLHNCLCNGIREEMHKWTSQEYNGSLKRLSISKFRAILLGRINYVNLINPHKGEQLLSQFNRIEFIT